MTSFKFRPFPSIRRGRERRGKGSHAENPSSRLLAGFTLFSLPSISIPNMRSLEVREKRGMNEIFLKAWKVFRLSGIGTNILKCTQVQTFFYGVCTIFFYKRTFFSPWNNNISLVFGNKIHDYNI